MKTEKRTNKRNILKDVGTFLAIVAIYIAFITTTLATQLASTDGQQIAYIVDSTNGNRAPETKDIAQKDGSLTIPEQHTEAVIILDNFNRPDGQIGPKWIGRSGTFLVSDMSATGNSEALTTYKGVNSNIVEADVRSNAANTGLEYVGIVLGYKDIDNNLFIKVQNQDSDTQFEKGACYIGNNGHDFGLGFFSLDHPFTNAHMRVQLIGNVAYITFSNIDGGPSTQTYTCTGAPNTGGNGVGIVGFAGISHVDNFAASSMAPVNLLKNPGFETSHGSIPTYWNKYQTGYNAIFTYPEIGRTGTGKSVAIRYPTKDVGNVALWRQSGIIVYPSSQYKLSGYMKLSNVIGSGHVPRPGGASLRVSWYRSDGSLIRTDVINKMGTSGWTKYDKIFTAPSNAAKAAVGGDLFDSSGKVWFDDMSFTKIY